MAAENIYQCPVCGGIDFKKKFECKDFTTSKESFQLVACTGCQLIITTPRPDSSTISSYYNSSSYISHSIESKNLIDKIYFLARKLALAKKKKMISDFSLKSKLLDVGCGTGEFIKYMTANG